MPGPNGPSRNMVGGTRFQPAARDTAYAATSRPASEPTAKSHSGRSPATGLYTHAASWPSRRTVQYIVAFEATTSLPSTSRRPRLSNSSAAALSSGCARCPVGRAAFAALGGLGRCARLPGDASGIGDPVTVLPWADVPFRVQREPAQRAGGPALADNL